MSDDQSPPQTPRSARPAGAQQAPRPRRRPPASAPSKESRFIGFLVLGFGLLAVIAVVLLAMGKKDTPTPQANGAGVTASDLQATLTGPTTARPQAPQQKLFFERDDDLDVGRMQGNWQANIGKYTAVLQLRQDVYQLILASADPAAPRIYSSGTYKVVEDIVMLTPRLDWPTPAVPKGRIIAYNKMTRAPFPVLVKFEGDKMLWQNVPATEKRVRAPFTSPLFLSEKVGVASWQKM